MEQARGTRAPSAGSITLPCATLPTTPSSTTRCRPADGLLEAGYRVPLDRLQPAMEDWFRRKGYLTAEDRLEVTELGEALEAAAAPGVF